MIYIYSGESVNVDKCSLKNEKKNSKKSIGVAILGLVDKYFFMSIILNASIVNFIIECLGRHSIKEGLLYLVGTPLVFLYNSFIIFASMMISYLFKRRIFATLLISIAWIFLGIVNGAILTFRVTPFTGQDFKMIQNGLSLIDQYMTPGQIILLAGSVILVVALIILIEIHLSKYTRKTNYKIMIPVVSSVLLMIIPLTNITVKAEVIDDYFYNIRDAYKDNGVPYSFWSTVISTGIDRPVDYSEESIKGIVDKNGEDSYPSKDKMPNIIFLQLESFVDPMEFRNLKFSTDPIPNFRSIKENYSTGYLTVPTVGAGTVNTEFEILTGMSIDYFGPGEYPYKTILSETVSESIAYNLKELGYNTHAIHNYEANFYNRKKVFSMLGFDTFTSAEYMNITEYTPNGWAKDSILIDYIMKALASTKGQDYVQAITVQGHGSYTSEVVKNPEIYVSGIIDETKIDAFEYYVNEMHEEDNFIGDLTEALSNYNEDVVLVMYGDHLPTLELEADDMKSNSEFNTEYVIWDNIGLEKEDENLGAYQLSSTVLDKLDIHNGTIIKFHQARRGTTDYYSDLNKLQYDMLYGEHYVYNGEVPFERTLIQMGIEEIQVTRIAKRYNHVYVTGKNFTENSKVFLNNEYVDTIYVDNKTLKLKDLSLRYGDTITVKQITGTGKTLSETDEFHYINPYIKDITKTIHG